MKNYDVIIIGGGPAGVSAALYAARSGLDVCVIDGGDSALARATLVQNYYGTGEVSGAELYARGLDQLQSVGATLLREQATFAQQDENGFVVSLPNGQVRGKRLVIATGARRKSVDVEGLNGSNVSYCAVCDAFFYRKKVVGVLGAGEFARHELTALERVASRAVLFTNGETPSFAVADAYTQKVSRILRDENGGLIGIALDDGTEVKLDGLFVAAGVCGGSAFAKSLGIMTDGDGNIQTDASGRTNVAGLYSAGDCTAGVRQVAKAVCDGMTVGMTIIHDIKSVKGGAGQ